MAESFEDFDKELDSLLGEANNISMEDDIDPSSREPVDVAKIVTKEVVNSYTDPSLLASKISNIIENNLPNPIKEDINTLKDVRDGILEPFTKTLKTIGNTTGNLLMAVTDILPEIPGVSSTARKIAEAFISKDDEGNDSVEESEDDKVVSVVNEIFGEQHVSERLKEKEEEIRRLADTELNLRNAVNLEYIKGYLVGDHYKYIKKSLELQMKQTLILADIRTNILNIGKEWSKYIKAIVKNTALPDTVKLNSSDVLEHTIRQKAIETGINLITKSKPIENLKESFANFMTEKASNYLLTTEMANDALKMMKDMGDMVPPEQKLAMMAEMLIDDVVLNRVGKKVIEKSDKFGLLGKVGFGLRRVTKSPSKFLEKIMPEKVRESNLFRDFNEILDEAFKNKASLQSIDLGESNINEATHFDIATKKSITTVIPGLLSKILEELKALRTGKLPDEKQELVFDYKTNRFVTKQNLLSKITSEIKDNVNEFRDNLANRTNNIIYYFFGESGLNPKDKADFEKGILNLVLSGKEIDPFRWIEDPTPLKVFKSNIRRKIVNRIKEMMDKPTVRNLRDLEYITNYLEGLRNSVKIQSESLQKFSNFTDISGLEELDLISKDSTTIESGTIADLFKGKHKLLQETENAVNTPNRLSNTRNTVGNQINSIDVNPEIEVNIPNNITVVIKDIKNKALDKLKNYFKKITIKAEVNVTPIVNAIRESSTSIINAINTISDRLSNSIRVITNSRYIRHSDRSSRNTVSRVINTGYPINRLGYPNNNNNRFVSVRESINRLDYVNSGNVNTNLLSRTINNRHILSRLSNVSNNAVTKIVNATSNSLVNTVRPINNQNYSDSEIIDVDVLPNSNEHPKLITNTKQTTNINPLIRRASITLNLQRAVINVKEANIKGLEKSITAFTKEFTSSVKSVFENDIKDSITNTFTNVTTTLEENWKRLQNTQLEDYKNWLTTFSKDLSENISEKIATIRNSELYKEVNNRISKYKTNISEFTSSKLTEFKESNIYKERINPIINKIANSELSLQAQILIEDLKDNIIPYTENIDGKEIPYYLIAIGKHTVAVPVEDLKNPIKLFKDLKEQLPEDVFSNVVENVQTKVTEKYRTIKTNVTDIYKDIKTRDTESLKNRFKRVTDTVSSKIPFTSEKLNEVVESIKESELAKRLDIETIKKYLPGDIADRLYKTDDNKIMLKTDTGEIELSPKKLIDILKRENIIDHIPLLKETTNIDISSLLSDEDLVKLGYYTGELKDYTKSFLDKTIDTGNKGLKAGLGVSLFEARNIGGLISKGLSGIKDRLTGKARNIKGIINKHRPKLELVEDETISQLKSLTDGDPYDVLTKIMISLRDISVQPDDKDEYKLLKSVFDTIDPTSILWELTVGDNEQSFKELKDLHILVKKMKPEEYEELLNDPDYAKYILENSIGENLGEGIGNIELFNKKVLTKKHSKFMRKDDLRDIARKLRKNEVSYFELDRETEVKFKEMIKKQLQENNDTSLTKELLKEIFGDNWNNKKLTALDVLKLATTGYFKGSWWTGRNILRPMYKQAFKSLGEITKFGVRTMLTDVLGLNPAVAEGIIKVMEFPFKVADKIGKSISATMEKARDSLKKVWGFMSDMVKKFGSGMWKLGMKVLSLITGRDSEELDTYIKGKAKEVKDKVTNTKAGKIIGGTAKFTGSLIKKAAKLPFETLIINDEDLWLNKKMGDVSEKVKKHLEEVKDVGKRSMRMSYKDIIKEYLGDVELPGLDTVSNVIGGIMPDYNDPTEVNKYTDTDGRVVMESNTEILKSTKTKLRDKVKDLLKREKHIKNEEETEENHREKTDKTKTKNKTRTDDKEIKHNDDVEVDNKRTKNNKSILSNVVSGLVKAPVIAAKVGRTILRPTYTTLGEVGIKGVKGLANVTGLTTTTKDKLENEREERTKEHVESLNKRLEKIKQLRTYEKADEKQQQTTKTENKNDFLKYLGLIWGGIKLIPKLLNKLIKGIFDYLPKIAKSLLGLPSLLKNVVTKTWDWIKNIFNKTKTLGGVVTAAENTSLLGSIGSWLKDKATTVVTTVKDKLNSVGGFLSRTWDKAKSVVGGMLNTVKKKFTSIITKIAEHLPGVSKILPKLKAVLPFINKIPIAGLITGLGTVGYDIIKGQWTKAAVDLASTVLSQIPGPGTAAATALTAATMSMGDDSDVSNTNKNETTSIPVTTGENNNTITMNTIPDIKPDKKTISPIETRQPIINIKPNNSVTPIVTKPNIHIKNDIRDLEKLHSSSVELVDVAKKSTSVQEEMLKRLDQLVEILTDKGNDTKHNYGHTKHNTNRHYEYAPAPAVNIRK